MKKKKRLQEKDYVDTLLARDYKDPKCVAVEPKRIGGLFDTEKSKHQAGAIWDKEYISPTKLYILSFISLAALFVNVIAKIFPL